MMNDKKYNTTNDTNNSDTNFRLQEMKKSIDSLTDMLLSSNNNTSTSAIIKTDIFDVNIFEETKENKEVLKKVALENLFSVGNFTSCENILRNVYNISEELPILKKQIEYDSRTNIEKMKDDNSSKLIQFEFFHPINKEKLNKSLCNSQPISLNIPFKKSSRLEMQSYTKAAVIKDIIDIYDSKSPGYHSRCLPTKDFETGADTSINFRRTQLFQNETISCSEGCTYKGLDENRYVLCDCPNFVDSEISNTGVFEELFSLPSMNYDILICYRESDCIYISIPI